MQGKRYVSVFIFHPSAVSRSIMKLKPSAKQTLPTYDGVFVKLSGMSSVRTTYIIAPAAKLSKNGRIGRTKLMQMSVKNAPAGSMAPDSAPRSRAFPRFIPHERRVREVMAPSGKF